MSAVIEWSVPFTLTSPAGSLALSGATGYVFDPEQCDSGADLRITKKPRPASDGEIFARRFRTGYAMQLAVELQSGDAIAEGSTLVSMWDALLTQLNALQNPSLADLVSSCRMTWTPTGHADRMLDRVRVLELPKPKGALPKTARFTLDTELPYAMDAAQTTTHVTTAATVIVTSGGSAAMRPVIKVNAAGGGAVTAFSIGNLNDLDELGNAKTIVYDSTLTGASSIASGHYVEITTDRSTVILDGSGADYFAGVDLTLTDWWKVVPGTNSFVLTGSAGVTADVLWQPAYT